MERKQFNDTRQQGPTKMLKGQDAQGCLQTESTGYWLDSLYRTEERQPHTYKNWMDTEWHPSIKQHCSMNE